MSASLETTNYKLPVYANQDTIAYIPDWNKAMRTIDTQMQMNKQKADGVESDIENLTDLVSAQGTEINTLTALVNGSAIQSLPKIQPSPGIYFNWFGYHTNEIVVANFESSWSPVNYDEIIKRDYSRDFVQLQAASVAGNPFNSTIGTLEDPASRGHGICFVRSHGTAGAPDNTMSVAFCSFAYINNVTNIYMMVHPENISGYRNIVGNFIIIKNDF